MWWQTFAILERFHGVLKRCYSKYPDTYILVIFIVKNVARDTPFVSSVISFSVISSIFGLLQVTGDSFVQSVDSPSFTTLSLAKLLP